MDCQKMLGVRGMFLGLVWMRTLIMVVGEGRKASRGLLESSSRVEVVMEEKRGVRVLVRDDTPTTDCRQMLANLEVRFQTICFSRKSIFDHFATSSQNGKSVFCI